MQKGVQKTEEMLVKVKDKYYWLLLKEPISGRAAQSLELGKLCQVRWESGKVSSCFTELQVAVPRLQPPTDGKPFYLVKNSLSSLIKEVEGSRTVLKVIFFKRLTNQFKFQPILRCVWGYLEASAF